MNKLKQKSFVYVRCVRTIGYGFSIKPRVRVQRNEQYYSRKRSADISAGVESTRVKLVEHKKEV